MKSIQCILFFIVCIYSSIVYAQTSEFEGSVLDTFQIKQAFISSGSIIGSNNLQYNISASAGQTAVDSVGNASQSAYFGFWYQYPQYIINSITFENQLLPKKFDLKQNYPNPFNPETTIEYAVPKLGQITIEVYNILGQRVMVLVNEEQNPGDYKITWNGFNLNGRSVSNGVYFYRMIAKTRDGKIFGKTNKMMYLK